ncbi:MAG TPA: PIN domain-containing protein [Gemmataceae bacterium]|nr:PIN domain-containing protein [Gemmataceae bacterium]
MTTVFADTSFYVALTSERDSLHPRAAELLAGHQGGILTTKYVLLEVANFLRRAAVRQIFTDLMGLIRTDGQSTILPLSDDAFDQGESLFAARKDKDWSLTDCISFVVTQEHGITEALTADHHFEQAGFVALLK